MFNYTFQYELQIVGSLPRIKGELVTSLSLTAIEMCTLLFY